MAAGCLIATGARLTGLPVLPGAVEAVFAGGAWFGALSSARRRDLERVIERTALEVEAEMAAWVPRSSQTDMGDLAHAKASFIDVLPRAMPAPADLVGKDLQPDGIAVLVLERAESTRPDIYKDKGPKDPANQLARHFLRQVIERACARLLADAEFVDDLRPSLWRELLERMTAIKEDTGAIREDTKAIRDTMATREDLTGFEARLLAAMEDRVATARASGITDAALIELARLISADISDPQQAFRELENAVEIAIRVQQEGRQDSNLGAFVDEVLARVAALAATGAYDEAASAIDAALVREAEEARLLEERRQESRARSLRLLDAAIEQDLLRRDAESAAARLVRKAEIELPEGASLFDHLRAVQDDWYQRGRDKGLNLDLEVVITLARHTVDLAADADQRGMALNDLGLARAELGTREAGTARLEQAVETYRLALEERTRERVPLDWAMMQNNLGNALQTLGTREAGTTRLEQAVETFRLALEERARERVPLDWATTQNNLGNALRNLGARAGDPARLEQALEAFRLALEERKRQRVPLQWATTQNNLGAALQELGTREAGTARLEQAVEAYRLALEERTRERVPLDWAMTQNNLGNALAELGEREDGTARLEQAATAYRLALEEWTREGVPLYWAMTQNNLGTALRELGTREAGTTRLEQAVTAYRLALEEWTRERVPLDWATTQNNLGNALRELGTREAGTARLEQALAAYRLALEEWTRERVPLDWATTQNNLGNALRELGTREAGTARLEQALAAYRLALEEWTPETAPYYHGIASQNLAHAQSLLDERRKAP
ncbi:tetratricopeptide repeat protein [Stappia indica]|nr:tetratricopeptide repeat protein [Stappia indica]